jgi:hypothetical protein
MTPHNLAPVPLQVGRWSVGERVSDPSKGEALYRCTCRCGAKALVRSSALRRGISESCGCLRNERTALASKRMAFRRRAGRWFRGTALLVALSLVACTPNVQPPQVPPGYKENPY